MSDRPDGTEAVAERVSRRFPKESRVRTAAQYQAILRRNRPVSAHLFEMYCFDAKWDRPRVGTIVGKRTLKRAVDRNYVKRIVREAFRLHASRLLPKDYVVRLRPAKRLTREALGSARQEIEALLLRFALSAEAAPTAS